MAFSKHFDPETMCRFSTTNHFPVTSRITDPVDPCTSVPYGQAGQQTLWSSLPNPLPQPFKFQGTLIIQNGNAVNWSGLTVKMAEGADIRIQSGGSLLLQNATIVEGCEKMWRGISVESGGTLSVNSSAQINDALNAIVASANSNISLINGRFYRNYRSLLAYSPNLSNITFSLVATGNLIDGLALKPPYSQQSEWSANAHAGFELRRCSSVGGLMNVGASTATKNTFKNCIYGILSQLSYLTIVNCRFEEFAGTSFFGTITGSGVYAERGQIKIRSSEFMHCTLAISLYKTFYEVSDNKFWALNKLVDAIESIKMGTGTSVMYSTIKNNTLLEKDPVTNISTGANWGFTLWYNRGGPQIFNNHLYNLDRSGIDIFDDMYSAGAASSGSLDNTITLKTNLGYPAIGGPAHGIRLVSTGRAYVCNNNIKFGIDDVFNIGVSAESSFGCRIGGNDFEQTATQTPSVSFVNRLGINYDMTDGSRLECNTYTLTDYGLRIKGQCNGTDIRTQVFTGPHVLGLEYQSASTGIQEHNGNRWDYTTASAMPGAYNNGFDVASNLYKVDFSDGAAYHPFVSPSDWFTNISGNTKTCNPNLPACTSIDTTSPPEIPDPQKGFPWYNDASVWLANRQALRRIALEGLTTTAPYSSYWTQKANTSEGKLAQMEADAVNWDATHENQMAQMGLLWADMSTLLEGSDQSTTAQTTFEQKRRQLDSLQQVRDSEYAQFLAAEALLNAALPEDKIYVLNQKRINALMLSLYNRYPPVFTATEDTMLTGIANQCSFEGGPAVLQARYLVSRYRTDTYDNDCPPVGERGLASASNASPIRVFPNPTTGAFQLLITDNPDTFVQLHLYNITGQMVWQQPLQSPLDRYYLPADIKPGIYLLEVCDAQGVRIGIRSLIVQ